MAKELSKKRKKAKKRLIIESFVFFIIASSPFVFKMHEYVSSDPEAVIHFFGYVIDRNGFTDISTYAWFMLGKIVPLFLLVVWFFTCKHWWYHSILIPITMYAFQIFEAIYSEDKFIDTENILWLLPVCMIVIPFVYFIRIKLYDKHVLGIDLEAIELELNTLKKKERYSKPIEDPEKAFKTIEKPSEYQEDLYLSFFDKIDKKLSTHNLENWIKQFQHNLKSWMHLKF